MKTCLNCQHCIMIERRTMLKCSRGQWVYPNESEKRVKCNFYEVYHGKMRDRVVFEEAEKCREYKSMV